MEQFILAVYFLLFSSGFVGIAALIAKGLANKEIAADLGISAATVRTHIYNLFQKIGAKSRIELLNILKD